jgi:copper transport protein
LLVTFAALLGLTGTASAHAQLDSSSPPADSVVTTAPQQILLSFDERVEVAANAIAVYDDHLQRVDNVAVSRVPREQNAIAVQLHPGLRNGTYTVSWHVSSSDTHPVSGTYRFSVGITTTVTGTVPGAGRNDAAGLLLGILRAVGFGGLILGPGVLLVTLLLWPAGLVLGRTRATLYAGLGLLGLSTLGSMLLQGVWASGRPLSAMWSAPSQLDTHSHRFDTLYGLRFYLLLAFGVLLVAIVSAELRSSASASASPSAIKPGRSATSSGKTQPTTVAVRGSARNRISTGGRFAAVAPTTLRRWAIVAAAAAGTLALLSTWSLAGHAAAGVQPTAAVAADLLHVAASTIWIGGLVLLNVSLRPAARASDLAAVLPRFSRLAFGCVVVLVATGSYQSWREVGSLRALTATTFGKVLMLKLGLVVIVLVLGNLARLWVQRHLTDPVRTWYRPGLFAPRTTAHAAEAAALNDRELDQSGPATQTAGSASTTITSGPVPYGPTELRRLRRGLTAELAIGCAVLAVTAALVVSVPSRQVYVRAYQRTLIASGLRLQVTVAAPRAGDTVLHLIARTPDGRPQPVTAIRGSLSEPSAALGPLPLRLANPSGASATGREDIGLSFPKRGAWTVQLTVQTSPVNATVFDFVVPVT